MLANCGLAVFQHGRQLDGIRILMRAFEAGNAAAGFNLGTNYWRNGQDGREGQALAFWRRGAAMGDVDAMVGVVGLALRGGDHASAEAWIEPVLAQDEPFAIMALALEFRDVGDWGTAMRAMRRAAALGHQPAVEYLARLHGE